MTVTHLHAIAVGISLGLYTILDVIFIEPKGFDFAISVWSMALICVALALSLAIELCLPTDSRAHLTIRSMAYSWVRTDVRAVLAVGAVVVLFQVYIFKQYGILSQFEDRELAQFVDAKPAWVDSLRVMIEGLAFGVFLYATSMLALRKPTRMGAVYLLLTLSVVLLAFGGRRSIMILVFLALSLGCILRNRHLYSIRNAGIMVVAMFGLLLFSNIFQTYRAEVFSLVVDGDSDKVANPAEAAANFEATADNLRTRVAVWKFNYKISELQIAGDMAPLGGEIYAQGLANSLPSALVPNKVVIDTDELIAARYGLRADDFTTSNFATLQADFGPGMMLAEALLIGIVLFGLVLLSPLAYRNPGFYLFACGYCIRYLVNIENAPGDIFILMRDVATIAAVFLGLRWLGRLRWFPITRWA